MCNSTIEEFAVISAIDKRAEFQSKVAREYKERESEIVWTPIEHENGSCCWIEWEIFSWERFSGYKIKPGTGKPLKRYSKEARDLLGI